MFFTALFTFRPNVFKSKNSSIRQGNTIDSKISIHSEFMLDIHKFLFERLRKLNIDDYYFDNTGDGHVCLVWNKKHAWTILDIVCSLSLYLERIQDYYNQHLKLWEQEYGKELIIGFGIGMHTGQSIIIKEKITGREFAYGTALNTAGSYRIIYEKFP